MKWKSSVPWKVWLHSLWRVAEVFFYPHVPQSEILSFKIFHFSNSPFPKFFQHPKGLIHFLQDICLNREKNQRKKKKSKLIANSLPSLSKGKSEGKYPFFSYPLKLHCKNEYSDDEKNAKLIYQRKCNTLQSMIIKDYESNTITSKKCSTPIKSNAFHDPMFQIFLYYFWEISLQRIFKQQQQKLAT